MSTYSNGATTSVYKFLLMESTNPHVFLEPTKITFSSYKWVQAPTSTCTRSNLYSEDNMFFLAPPYHPCSLDSNMFITIWRKPNITMHTNYVLIYFWICLCTCVPLIIYVLSRILRTYIISGAKVNKKIQNYIKKTNKVGMHCYICFSTY